MKEKTGKGRKKFWQIVTLVTIDGEPPLYRILLDDRPVTLPGGQKLEVLSQPLAQALKREWAQIEPESCFSPDDLELTRLTGTLIERVPHHRAEIIKTLLAYGIDDALCYPGQAQDHDLRQHVLDWVARQGLHPKMTEDLMPVMQDETYHHCLSRLLDDAGDEVLTVLSALVPLTGSLLLSWTLIHHIISEEEAFRLAFADEQYQLMIWGQDEELAQRLAHARNEIKNILYFYNLLKNKV